MAYSDISRKGNSQGVFTKVSENFGIVPRLASRVYKQIRKKVVEYTEGLGQENVSNTILLPDDLFRDGYGNRGAKVKYPRDTVAEDIERIPLMSRGKG